VPEPSLSVIESTTRNPNEKDYKLLFWVIVKIVQPRVKQIFYVAMLLKSGESLLDVTSAVLFAFTLESFSSVRWCYTPLSQIFEKGSIHVS
jgi:hypothetical protein